MSLNADSTAADNATAATSIQSDINAITAAVTSATTQVQGISLVKRQTDVNSLASLVENLLLDVSGALNNVITDLGLSKSFAQRLGGASHITVY